MRDDKADSLERQKEHSDANGRGCIENYEVGDQVLFSAKKPTCECFEYCLEVEVASALY